VREIKCRAWDKELKRMITVKLFSRVMPENWGEFYEVMQFIGWHDKKIVEIYEGDILNFKLNTKYGYIKMTGVVRCEDLASGCFVQFLPLGIEAIPFDFNIIEPEVIGNIYENPELLK